MYASNSPPTLGHLHTLDALKVQLEKAVKLGHDDVATQLCLDIASLIDRSAVSSPPEIQIMTPPFLPPPIAPPKQLKSTKSVLDNRALANELSTVGKGLFTELLINESRTLGNGTAPQNRARGWQNLAYFFKGAGSSRRSSSIFAMSLLTQNVDQAIANAFSKCVKTADCIDVFWKYRKQLYRMKLGPADDISRAQIAKDVTREVFRVDGELMKDHTVGSAQHIGKMFAKVKTLLRQTIPMSGLPEASEEDRLQRCTDVVLKGMARTNAGADSFNKVMRLFRSEGSRFLVKPSEQTPRPTAVHISASKVLIETYNDYDVVFLDKRMSPIIDDKHTKLLVKTRLLEMIKFDETLSSKRVMSMIVPQSESETRTTGPSWGISNLFTF